jgi:hypothetical protein
MFKMHLHKFSCLKTLAKFYSEIIFNLKKNTVLSLFRIHIPFKFDTKRMTIKILIWTKFLHDYKIKIDQKYNLMSYQHRVYCEN